VCVATAYGLDDRSSILSRGKILFSIRQHRDCFPQVMRSEREIDHSSPSSTEVKNSGAIFPLAHKSFFFFIYAVRLWVLRPLTGLLYQPRMIGDGDFGEIGGMKTGRGNRSTRRKSASAPLCPPQIPHILMA
jgi:hypothetical protein